MAKIVVKSEFVIQKAGAIVDKINKERAELKSHVIKYYIEDHSKSGFWERLLGKNEKYTEAEAEKILLDERLGRVSWLVMAEDQMKACLLLISMAKSSETVELDNEDMETLGMFEKEV